jgi:hypothetical protein
VDSARHIKEQKASAEVERLSDDTLNHGVDSAIATEDQINRDLRPAAISLETCVSEFALPDSRTEVAFLEALDTSAQRAVCSEPPLGVFHATSVGGYSPDLATVFTEGSVKLASFVVATKGPMSSMQLRGVDVRESEHREITNE